MTTHIRGTGEPGLMSVAATIPSSCLHDIFRAADRKERLGGEVVKLHVGEPYFGPPEEVAEALAAAVRQGRTAYSEVEGLLELREAVVEKLATANGVDSDPSRVVITPGSCQGLSALLHTLAEPGAEILLPELHWPVHLQQALLAGFRPVFYPLDAGFRPDPEGIRAKAGPRTRVLLVNSPANPTGAVLDAGQLTELLELAREHGWGIISDEAYEHYVYDGGHVSFASLERDVPVAERIVHSTFSFSKSLAMTGYRLGYVAAADDRTAHALRVVQEASIIGPSTPVQYAGIAALRLAGATDAHRELVRRNRDTALAPLVAAGLLSELPAGGWYAMADISRTGLDAEEFTARLLASRSVAVVAGTGFATQPRLDEAGRIRSTAFAPWSRHLVRIAFCVAPEALRTGVRRLVEFVESGEYGKPEEYGEAAGDGGFSGAGAGAPSGAERSAGARAGGGRAVG
ncbi:pyridoxal phosphate-dependent aminotransferase [Streptomyces sp. LP05-1]|uniref:Aminotransferase n=1 Tax=Streptomyces pyxinae TaxID=2970734 RepID=A0ABT2CNP1_9ACTN|nr:pyridoxal phosphate-dependent aminotransferase [Streptomyces sp. LP05-1]MCS0639056.1 pyridoxal phosphate-dependent aminotransferase [Streptomyces sp. LP05-1]